MSLANYKPKTELVTVSGQPLHLRGLSVAVISLLVQNHLTQVDALMDRYAANNRNIFADNAGDNLILMLVRDAPEITSFLIAHGAGEPEAIEQAAAIPFPSQVEILGIIGRLTFEDAGGPKQFFETLRRLRTTMVQ